MVSTGERIIIVEGDPDIRDVIATQALKPLGLDVRVVGDAASAIQLALQTPPDVIITNLNLPDLSGKDLLTALTAQGITAPVVVVAEKGQEQRVIQAFRLGAADALFWPARDAEIVRVVERALRQTRAARARQHVEQQLRTAHVELEGKVRELTILLSVARAVISVSDQRKFLGRLLEAALQVAEADISWLTLRDDRSNSYMLRAYRNLPASWAKKLDQPLDDGLSSMVAQSRQSLTIRGDALDKFKIATLGKSVAVLPLKVQDDVLGLLVVVRKADRDFQKSVETLLQAICDFGAIALVNSRLFRALQRSAETARLDRNRRGALVDSLRTSIRDELRASTPPLESLLSGESGTLPREQQQALKAIQASLKHLARAAEKSALQETSESG
jgi:DNA-binding response OmpR family regulator